MQIDLDKESGHRLCETHMLRQLLCHNLIFGRADSYLQGVVKSLPRPAAAVSPVADTLIPKPGVQEVKKHLIFRWGETKDRCQAA